MRIRGIRLPSTEMFPCSRRTIKESFAASDLAWVSFGSPIRSFRFDNQVSHRPTFVGPVVASLAINRERQAHLCIYPIRRSMYPETALECFSAQVVGRLHEWLGSKQSQPATGILGHEEIVVEWARDEHKFHELRFL